MIVTPKQGATILRPRRRLVIVVDHLAVVYRRCYRLGRKLYKGYSGIRVYYKRSRRRQIRILLSIYLLFTYRRYSSSSNSNVRILIILLAELCYAYY